VNVPDWLQMELACVIQFFHFIPQVLGDECRQFRFQFLGICAGRQLDIGIKLRPYPGIIQVIIMRVQNLEDRKLQYLEGSEHVEFKM